jgi:hypothetical protein
MRDDQYQLFAWLGAGLEHYFDACRSAQTYPQIWVPSAPAAAHLDILADRLRFNQQDARVRRAGELLTYATERYPVAGQQALQTATGALRAHWATGQQPGEDEHLGALLAWADPTPGVDIFTAVAAAESEPMGAKTDPEFDRVTLEPLVAAYNAARRSGASQQGLAQRAQFIHDALEPVVLRIYQATQRAIALLLAHELPSLPALAHLERDETYEFLSFMRSRDAGYHLPLRDQPKAAAFKLAAREVAAENQSAALQLDDGVARTQARLAGRILSGMVEQPTRHQVGPRRFEYTFDVVSTQRSLRVRLRDELHWIDDPRLKVTVTGIRRAGHETRVSLRIISGQQAVGLPNTGDLLEFVPGTADWDRLRRTRVHLARVLATPPWTHAAGTVPASASRPAPADPLAAVEALR